MKQLRHFRNVITWRIKHFQFERWERKNFKVGTRVMVGSTTGTITQLRPMMVRFDSGGKVFHVMPGVDRISLLK